MTDAPWMLMAILPFQGDASYELHFERYPRTEAFPQKVFIELFTKDGEIRLYEGGPAKGAATMEPERYERVSGIAHSALAYWRMTGGVDEFPEVTDL